MKKSRYNILVINWQDITHPLGGGAEVHLHEIFKRLVQRGHSVKLLCCAYEGAEAEEVIDGIHIIRKGNRSFFNYIVPFMYRKLSRQYQLDVVFDDINKIPFYTPLYVRKPLIGIVHHLFGYRIFQETIFPAAFYVFISERFVPLIYQNIPIMAVSPSSKNELKSMGMEPDKIEIIYNGVNCDIYRPEVAEKSPTPLVGYVGRIKRYKSVEHLIFAIKKVVREISDARLLIVGEGDNLKELKKIASENKLSEIVHFTGTVSEEQKIKYFNQLWVSVNSSPKEGWGIVVVEANACGTPVIAADSPGLRDSVVHGQTGLLYPYGNIDKLSETIIYLLKNSEERQRLAEGALKWAQQFDWDISADKTEQLIEKVIFHSKEVMNVS